MSTGLSRSISHQPSYSSYGKRQPVTTSNIVGSLSSNSFNYGSGAGVVGNGNGFNNGMRRNRSQSADGRRDYERDTRGVATTTSSTRGDSENADEWLARQKLKLQQKKASKHVV
jgi:hypothetical protein